MDYTDNVPSSVSEEGKDSSNAFFRHFRPDTQTVSYKRISPKLGLIHTLGENQSVYVNYRHSFRVPSIGDLFRSGSSNDTDQLKPVNTDSVELGYRGQWVEWLHYDVTAYYMQVTDDIVKYIDNNTRKVTNAGRTYHRGIELGLYGELSPTWGFRTAWSVSRQTYGDFKAVYRANGSDNEINHEGQHVGKAPAIMGQSSIQYRPSYLKNTQWEVEWDRIGPYYTDETNKKKYDGHHLFNARVTYTIATDWSVYARVLNIGNTRYSTYTSSKIGEDSIEYRPGFPRTIFAGVRGGF